jgi:hypothetical protein
VAKTAAIRVHPHGYAAMANAVDLSMLRRGPQW